MKKFIGWTIIIVTTIFVVFVGLASSGALDSGIRIAKEVKASMSGEEDEVVFKGTQDGVSIEVTKVGQDDYLVEITMDSERREYGKGANYWDCTMSWHMDRFEISDVSDMFNVRG